MRYNIFNVVTLSSFIDCQPLTIPDHGSISTNILSQGTVVFVECESGYTLFGATTLQCRTDATWNSVEPTCKLGILTVISFSSSFGCSKQVAKLVLPP